jgi:hypothetical protein
MFPKLYRQGSGRRDLNQRLLSAGSDRSKNENRYDENMYQATIIFQPNLLCSPCSAENRHNFHSFAGAENEFAGGSGHAFK